MVILLLSFVSFALSVVTVHVLPHSHCDPGYRESTIGYFYDKVKPIFDNTIAYTIDNPTKKYIWVETAFLQLWWDQASEESRSNLQTLVKRKQWEIVMGGWVMNDQATVTYSSSINQLTTGHQYVKETLGVCPRQGFSIDPFGASPVQSALYKAVEYDYYIINRIPVETKTLYRKDKKLQNYWTDESFNGMDPIFTHIMYDHYSPPDGIGISFWHGIPVTPEDIDFVSQNLVEDIQKRNDSYLGSGHLLYPYGGDFSYTNPEFIYKNMDKVIDYINNHAVYSKQYFLKYSTLSEFYDSIDQNKIPIPTISDKDYFVYDHPEDRWWSGYFTSQPKLKTYARKGESLLKDSEMLHTMSVLYNNGLWSDSEMVGNYKTVRELRRKNGELLHHDAITGTCKWVAEEYYTLELDVAFVGTEILNKKLVSQLVSTELFKNNSKVSFVTRELIEGHSFGDVIGVVATNSLGWGRNEFVHVYFDNSKKFAVEVTDLLGNEYDSAVVEENENLVVIFKADFPAFGFKHFLLKLVNSEENKSRNYLEDLEPIENEFYKIFFDGNNKINRIQNKKSGIDMKVSIDFFTYESKSDVIHGNMDSDAYAFSPVNPTPDMMKDKPTIEYVVDNDIVVEIHQKYTNYMDTVIRLYKGDVEGANFMEIEIKKLGVVPEHKEVIVRATTEIENKKVLFHDELGFEIKRKEYFIPPTESEAVQANYYPMQYSSYIRDDKHQFTILVSKAQGAASQENGCIETMIHRRPSGVGISVFPYIDDVHILRNSKMRFLLDTVDKSKDMRHKQSYLLNYPLKLYYFEKEFWNIAHYPYDFLGKFSFFKNENGIDNRIHMMSLDKIYENPSDKEFVLRFANIYEKGETDTVTVPLNNLFKKNITSIVESSLSLMKDKGKKNDDVDLDYLNIKTFKVSI